jgi:hypothetical protein
VAYRDSGIPTLIFHIHYLFVNVEAEMYDFLFFILQAWALWKEGKARELIDSRIKESCVVSEASRCIHVSLLCVQQYPEDRPTMTSVVQMLGSEMELVEPKEPGFFPRKVSDEPNQNEISSNEELTITSLNGR